MTRSRVPALLIAVLSISALGVAATTLDTTLSTDPEDEIDPDWDDLPIGQDDAATLREEIDGAVSGSNPSETRPGDGDAEPSGAVEDPDPNSDVDGRTGSGLGELLERASGGEGATGGGSDSNSGLGTGSSDSGTGDGNAEQTLLDRLLALLVDLLGVLVPLAALVALAAIVYRYRDTLWALLSGDHPGDTTRPASAAAWPGVDPATAVDRAWLTLVRRLDPERPETLTTGECRELARERGFDAEAVDAITAAFERVHYGGVPPAEEEGRARDALRRFEGEIR